MILLLAGGIVALALLATGLVVAARVILTNWLSGANGMALFTFPALEAIRGAIGGWWKAGLGLVLGAALALPVGQCQGRDAERAAGKARAAEAAAAAHKANTARVEVQAAQREADTARNLNLSKGRTDAIQAGPDGPLSGPERRLQCRRLRDIGYGPADLPPGC